MYFLVKFAGILVRQMNGEQHCVLYVFRRAACNFRGILVEWYDFD